MALAGGRKQALCEHRPAVKYPRWKIGSISANRKPDPAYRKVAFSLNARRLPGASKFGGFDHGQIQFRLNP